MPHKPLLTLTGLSLDELLELEQARLRAREEWQKAQKIGKLTAMAIQATEEAQFNSLPRREQDYRIGRILLPALLADQR